MNTLEPLLVRDEILQAMFWLRGEGLADRVTPELLASVLVCEASDLNAGLDHLVLDGYLERIVGERALRLTELGVREGGRRFRDEFDGLTRQAHGECGPACWCRDPKRAGEACPSLLGEHAYV